MRNTVVLVQLAVIVAGFGAAEALSGTPRTGGWVPNGAVKAIMATPSAIYIGGDFTCLSPYTGNGVVFDMTSGELAGTFPQVNEIVRAVVPDGSGGWYIGGEFTRVGTTARNFLCHILSSGSVDSAWNPSPDGMVMALALFDGKLYVGGQFTGIAGESRSYIAALNAATGAAEEWDPGADYTVKALCVSGSTVYAAGEFNSIGGASRSFIGAVDITTGAATAWDPAADSSVCTLALGAGAVFAGGCFSSIGGESRGYIAALSPATGLATAWNPGANSCVNTLAVSGGVVFAGGSFTTMGGQPRNRVAALDEATGAPTDFNPGANSTVDALFVSGGTLYAGGEFATFGGQPRCRLAAATIATGAVTDWNPTASATIYAFAVSGSNLYVGGDFNGIGGVIRKHVAALDPATLIPTDWNPDASGVVYALATIGDMVYVGGVFSQIAGQSRDFLAALDATTGAAAEWAGTADNEVLALCASGSTLYVGGSFNQIGGASRNCLAALDANTGAATAWDPNSDGTVYSLALSEGTLFAGGTFWNIGGQTRRFIGAVSLADGTATGFNPNADDAVYAVAVSGSTVYAGGNFTSAGGESRNRLASFDAATGAATAWDPSVDGVVYALSLSGSNLFVGGSFIAVGTAVRNNLALVDATGLSTAWQPNPDGVVKSFAVTADSVSVGGAFASIGGVQQECFAQFDASLPAPSEPGATAIGLNSITWIWTDNSGEETGFNVYSDPGAGPPVSLRHTTAANDESWQQLSLGKNTQYAFQVAATNGTVESQKTANYTAWTNIEPVTSLVFTGVSASAVSVAASGTFTNLTSGSSGLCFQNLTCMTSSGWRQHNDAWASTGLQPNTLYSFTGQSRNGAGSTTTTLAVDKYTLAAAPVAPVVSNPTVDSLDVAVGSGSGNPANTLYALRIEPGVSGKNWIQAGGGLGVGAFFQTAAAWGVVTVAGLSDGTVYSFSATAKNGEGLETAPGPAAEGQTLSDLVPGVTLTLVSPAETGADTIYFQCDFDEPVSPAFSSAAVLVNGLQGNAAVTGDFPTYTVAVELADGAADGTVSITVPADLLYDGDDNACPGGTSDMCHVYNWRGFVEEPDPVAAYTGDTVTLDVTAGCGASCLVYAWQWDDGAKTVSQVGENSPVLLLEHVGSAAQGAYWCEVSYDGSTHATNAARLSVRDRVRLLPLAPQTVDQGQTCTFSAVATGGYAPLAYSWARNGETIDGATASTYTTSPLNASDSGSTYTVTVTDSNDDAESASAQITVIAAVPAVGLTGKAIVAGLLTVLFLVCHTRGVAGIGGMSRSIRHRR